MSIMRFKTKIAKAQSSKTQEQKKNNIELPE
jgi:hypothetical protein